MGRSLKKGPFVDEHLMNKVEAQAGLKRKKLSKLGLVVRPFSQVLLDIPSQYTMDVNTYQFTSKKIW